MRTLPLVIALCCSVAAQSPTLAASVPTGAASTVPNVTLQKARTVRATDFRDLPSSDGKLLVVVPANTEIAVAERRGGWYRVRVTGREGWMRLTAVRFASATPDSSGGFTAPLAFLKSGRSAAQTGTVTTGVRGLSETDLANSTPDPAAVDALEALAIPASDAEGYARELGLASIKVKFVKLPKKPDKDDDDDEGKD